MRVSPRKRLEPDLSKSGQVANVAQLGRTDRTTMVRLLTLPQAAFQKAAHHLLGTCAVVARQRVNALFHA